MMKGVNYARMRRNRINSRIITGTVIACIIAVIGFITYGSIQYYNHKETHVVTVTEKNIKRSNEHDVYMFYTEDEKGKTLVFENTDSLLAHKYNSADVYQQIKVGKKYRLETRGYRFEVWSTYPNVITFEEVK